MRRQVIITLLLLTSVFVNAQQNYRQKHFNLEEKVALQGYDPVSYFSGSPEKGKASWAYNYQGIIYHFSSAQHLEVFKQNSTQYEPQYGGWCAYAMGTTGEKVVIDPMTFKIIGGKLYLFYNKFFNNTLKSWNKNEAKLKAQADANWKKYQ